MKVQPTTKDLIAMLYERAPYLFDVAAQPEPAAWLGRTKLPCREGVPILIFTDKTLADQWLNGFVEGFAWLEPLYRSMKLPAAPAQPEAKREQGSPSKPHKKMGHP